MIYDLERLIQEYPGEANRARCFNHVVALVAKRVVRQFDVPSGGDRADMNEAERELRELAEGLDIEEMVAQHEQEMGDEDDDNVDEWTEKMIVNDEELEESARPVRMLLVKVS